MATWDEIAGGGSKPAGPGAPSGLTGSWQQYVRGDSWQANKMPAWQTGGNPNGIASGFSNEFFETMRAQRDAEARKIDADPNYQSKLYQHDDFTGIVTWDQQFQDGPENKRKFQTGDVYENGVFRYNLYNTDRFSLEEANGILAGQVLGDDAGRVYESARGDQNQIRDAVMARGQEFGKQWMAGQSSAAAEERKNQILADWDEDSGGWDNAIAVLGQAAMGATQGAVFGPWGILGGALVGTVAGVLNQDEILDMAARASMKTEQAFNGEGGSTARGFGAAAEAFGSMAINQGTLRGILHGAYDASTSGNGGFLGTGIGDGDAAWYNSQDRGAALDILDAALMFGDSALQMGSKLGQAAYVAGTSAYAAGRATTLSTGYVYDEYAQQWTAPENTLAAIASVGIDATQMFVPFVLGRSLRAPQVTNKVDDLETFTGGGRTFQIKNGEVLDRTWGRQIADGAAAMLAPSSFVDWVGLRAAAHLSNKAGERITTQVLYNAVDRLERNPGMYSMLMNGFGEAIEEVSQTVLDNVALGYGDFDAMKDEIVNAALMGFAGGAGMTAGIRLANKLQNVDQKDLDAINTLNVINDKPEITMKELKAMSGTERLAARTATQPEKVVIAEGARRMATEAQRVMAATNATAEVQQEAAATLSARMKLSGSGVENMRAVVYHNVARPGYEDAAFQSFTSTRNMIQDRVTAIAESVKALTDRLTAQPDNEQVKSDLDYGTRSLQLNERILAFIDAQLEAWTNGTEDAIRVANEYLENVYNGYLPDDNGVVPSRSDKFVRDEAGFIISRSPTDGPGSFPMVMLQIDRGLSLSQKDSLGVSHSGDGVIMVSQALEKVLTQDNDGDQTKNQIRARAINGASAESMRRGDYLRSRDGWLISERAFEKRIREQLSLALADPNSDGYAAADQALMQLEQTLKNIFKNQRGMGAIIEKYVGASKLDKKKARIRSRDAEGRPALGALGNGSSTWKEDFYRELEKNFPTQVNRLYASRITIELPSPSGDTITRTFENRSPMLLIEGVIQAHLQAYRVEKAIVTTDTLLAKEGYQPVSPTALADDLRIEAAVRASSFGIDLQQQTTGHDAFRAESRLAYTPYNSASLEQLGYEGHPVLQMLTRIYNAINTGRETSKIEALMGEADPILVKARRDLEYLARNAFPNVPLSDAVLAMSTWSVADISQRDLENGVPVWRERQPTSVSLFQRLLKNAAEDVIRESNLPMDDAGSRPFFYRNLTPEQANNALLAAMPVEDIVGRDLAIQYNLLGTTVAMATANYMGLGKTQRQAQRDRWRDAPEYLRDSDGNHIKNGFPYPDGVRVSSWTLFVDTVTGNADPLLAHGENGRVTGTLNDINLRDYHEAVDAMAKMKSVFQQSGKLFRRGSLMNIETLRREGPKHLQRTLRSEKELFKYFLRSLPTTLQAVLPTRKDGMPQDPLWIYEALLAEPEEAVMIVFRQTLLHNVWLDSLSLEERISDPSDPWVALVRDVRERGLGEMFLDRLSKSKDVLDFQAWVNETFRQDEAPILAYASDLFLADLSSTRGGWSWISANTERRDAIRDLQNYANGKANGVESLSKNYDDDKDYVGTIRNNPLLMSTLENRLASEISFQQAAAGPTTIRAAAESMAMGLDTDFAKKNKMGVNVGGMGAVESLMDGRLYGALEDVVQAERLNVHINELRQNPRRLLRPLRIQFDEGRSYEWSPVLPNGKPNVEQFLSLYTARDGIFKPLLQQVFFRSNYAADGEGGVQLSTAQANQSLRSFVESKYYKSLLTSDSFKSNIEYLSLVQSLQGNFQITELITALMVEHGGGSIEQQNDRDNSFEQAVNEVARTLKELGSFSELAITKLTEEAKVQSFRMTVQGKDTDLSTIDNPRATIRRRRDEVAQTLLQTTDVNEREALQLQLLILEQQETTDTAVDYIAANTQILWDNPNQVTLMQANLAAYLEMHADDLKRTTATDESVAIQKWEQNPRQLSEKDWDAISSAVGSDMLRRDFLLQPTSINNGSYLLNEAFRFFGRHDRSYLLDMALESAKAARDFRLLARPNSQPVPTSDNPLLTLRSRLRIDDMPPFSPDYVLQHVGNRQKLASAAAEHQLNAVGSAFQRLSTMLATSVRSLARPDVSSARTLRLTHAEAAGATTLVSTYDHRVGDTPLAILQGATVVVSSNARPVDPTDELSEPLDKRGIRVGIELPDGTQIDRPIQMLSVYDPTTDLTLENGKPGDPRFRTLDLERLETAANNLNLPQGSKVLYIDVDYFHPLDQPTTEEFANSVAYGGRMGNGSYDNTQSLYATAWQGSDGFMKEGTRVTMDARKNQASAIQLGGKIDPADTVVVSSIEELVHDQAWAYLNLDRGEASLPLSHYKFAYKVIIDHMILTDEAGTRFTPYQIMQGAEVQGTLTINWLSERVLNTLRGGIDEFALPVVLEDAPRYINNQRPWTGVYSDEEYARVPDLRNVDVASNFEQFMDDLAASDLVNNAAVHRANSKLPDTITARRTAIQAARRFRREVDNVVELRLKPEIKEQRERINRTNFDRVTELVNRTISSYFLPSGPPVNGDDSDTERRVARVLNKVGEYLNKTGSQLWVYETAENTRYTRDDGVITKTTLRAESRNPVAPTLDPILVLLDGLGDGLSTSWESRVRSHFQGLVETRQPIMPFSTNVDVMDEARRVLSEMGYVSENNWIWAPVDDASLYPNERARDLAWTRTTPIDAQDMVLVEYSDEFPVDASGAFFDPEAGLLGGTAFKPSVIATTGSNLFSMPLNQEAGERAADLLERLSTPSGLDYLATQSLLADGTIDSKSLKSRAYRSTNEYTNLLAVWEARVRKARNNLDISTGAPQTSKDVHEVGDLWITQNPGQKTFRLVLIGHEPISDREAMAQIRSNPGGFATAVYSEKLLSTSVASTPLGTITEIIPDGKYGIRARLKQSMGLVAQKFVLRSAYKLRPTNVRESTVEVPESNILGSIIPGIYTSATDPIKKGMIEDLQIDAASSLSFWGANFVPLLAEATGAMYTDESGARVKVSTWQTYGTLNESQQREVRENVQQELVRRRQSTTDDRLYTGSALAQAVIDNIEGLGNVAPTLIDERIQKSLPAGYNVSRSLKGLSNVPPAQIFMAGVDALLRHPQVKIDHLMNIPGIANMTPDSAFSFEAMPVFGLMFKYPALKQWVQDDINTRQDAFNTRGTNGDLLDGRELQPDWTIRTVTTKNGKTRERTSYYAYTHVSPTGEDFAELVQHRENTNVDDHSSEQLASFGFNAARIDTGYNIQNPTLSRMFKKRDSLDSAEGIATTFTRTPAALNGRKSNLRSRTPRERNARVKARRWARATEPLLDRSDWQSNDIYDKLSGDILRTMGFPPRGYRYIVDQMVRLRLGALAEKNGTGARAGQVSQQDAESEANEILRLVRNNEWFIDGAAIPVVPVILLQEIINKTDWRPEGVTDLSSAVDNLMGRLFLNGREILHPEFIPAIDGVLHQYEYLFDYDLVSISREVTDALLDPTTGGVVTTMDSKTGEYLQLQSTDADGNPNALFYYGGAWNTGAEGGEYPPSLGISKRRAYQDRRRNKIGGTIRQTGAQINKEGRRFGGALSASNRAFRGWQKWVAFLGMANPELMLWGPAEILRNTTIENTVRLLTGDTTLQIRARNWFISRTENVKAMQTRTARALRSDIKPYLTTEDIAFRNEIARTLATTPEWRSMVNKESQHRIVEEDAVSRLGQVVDKGLDIVGRAQDPLSNIYMGKRARIYVDAALRWAHRNKPELSAHEILLHIRQNRRILEQDTLGIHAAGIQEVQRRKGFERTVPAAVWDTAINAATKSPNGLIATSANLLKGLTMFQNFFWTTGMITTGTQGLNAILAVLLQGNKTGHVYGSLMGRLTGNKENADQLGVDLMQQVLGQTNLAQAMLRGQVSMMHVFMLGLMFSSLGLTGEDDEERRRRREQMYQGLAPWSDPADLMNDFRNTDSLYFDNIPLLGELFQVPSEEGQPERSPVDLHWTLKLFASPLMGMADFLDTGNIEYLLSGYRDAVGSLPFANILSWQDAEQTARTLAEAAAAGSTEAVEPGQYADAMNPVMSLVFLLERVTMENAFISGLYNSLDKYNRNPWVYAGINDDGTIRTNALGNPISSEAEQYMVNDQGETYEGDIYRDSVDGQNRAVISQRPVLATMMNMLFSTSGTINSFNRYDMVPSELIQFKDELSFDEASLLLLTVWDPYQQREVLTRDGADALIQSLGMGTVKITDPALDGVYIDIPTRQAVAEDLYSRIFIEGMEVYGLTEDESQKRLNAIWYGDPKNPNAVPLYDVIWNKGEFAGEGRGISWTPTTAYQQLNTTWAMGPDGKMWATGMQRGTLFQAFGLNPFMGSQAAENPSNLGLDGNLNNVDVFTNKNLGRRGLEKVGDWDIPNEEDIIRAIEESTDRMMEGIKDLQRANYESFYNRGGYNTGRRGGGGGGGGGGGYSNNPLMPFLNAMKNPYADNIPNLYINNINVRRASVRRERFSSERGRLNNQQ
ncbi:hypothetical protein SEA_WESAK_29 [Microbacterium phage Wesak]|uniref:Uncharacterized protein n=1 Tax=Microbacterium phage Wesak TaxID=2653751 RepID=A0A5Q2WH29_9CAUD|nr:hypothetical protein SEA_WESAK_29 [Microbacterium phage Wesak]